MTASNIKRLVAGVLSISLTAGLSWHAVAGPRQLRPVNEKTTAKLKEAMPTKATAKPKKARKVLVFCLCNGFFHGSIPVGNKCLEMMGEKTGAYEAVVSQDMAIAWVREFGKGRVFYCSLGHRNDVYWSKQVLQHYLDGIQYALGDLEADATPTAEAREQQPTTK